jgi:hypothetical protein
MTDPHDFDELASAHLDGVTSPEEAARVEANPALLARVEELRAVRAALGEVPAVDATRRDAAITAALAAFEEDGAGRGAVALVTPLAARRLSPTTVRVLSAAAVVAILALLVPLLSGIDGGDDDATFEATGDAIERDSDASADGPDAAAESDGSTTVLNGAAADADLGTYDDLDALAAAVTSGELDAGSFDAPNDQGESAVQLCAPAPTADTRAGTAVVAGEPVVVWIGVTPEGRQVLTVLRAGGCEVLDEREL